MYRESTHAKDDDLVTDIAFTNLEQNNRGCIAKFVGFKRMPMIGVPEGVLHNDIVQISDS